MQDARKGMGRRKKEAANVIEASEKAIFDASYLQLFLVFQSASA